MADKDAMTIHEAKSAFRNIEDWKTDKDILKRIEDELKRWF